MLRHGLTRSAAFLAALFSLAIIQQKNIFADEKPPAQPAKEAQRQTSDDYRQFFRKPQTVIEFWKALQFELEVGRFDLAAAHLHGLLASKPSDEALVELADQEGMGPILLLRNIKMWIPVVKLDLKDTKAEIARLEKSKDNPDRLNQLRDEVQKTQKEYDSSVKLNKQAEDDVETLITSITTAVKKVRGDPKRIAGFIKELTESPEEADYALKELYKAGALAAPPLIDSVRSAEGADRSPYLEALRRLGPDVVPPMVAALESNDIHLKADLLDVLRRKVARDIVPHLWFLSASPSQAELVRRKATEMLAAFLDTPASKLLPAKQALVREAERYYHHEVPFPDPSAVTVWRWQDGHVVAGWPGAPTIPATAAEEYYGLHFANQALALDPSYQPAQIVMLSIAIDKCTERAGQEKMLATAAPGVHELLATASPKLVGNVLERALDERRTPVVLNCVRTLGGLADARANRSSVKGEPVLVRALHYPDRRVQMAAAEAILRGPDQPPATARILDIFRRALAADPGTAGVPKVLVGYFNDEVANRVADGVRQAGFEPVKARTGREVMKRLGQAADIDLLLLDAALPDPGLASLLGQLGADNYAAGLPIILTTSADREDALRRFTARNPNISVVATGLVLTPQELQGVLKSRNIGHAVTSPLSEAEMKDYTERAIRHLNELAHGEPAGVDIRPDMDSILDALRAGTLSPEGQLAAISAADKLPGTRTQNELAAVILDKGRPLPVRVAATRELVHQIQQSSVLLTRGQTGALGELFSQQDTEPPLKSELALLLGSLKPDARQTGERLLRYQPIPTKE